MGAVGHSYDDVYCERCSHGPCVAVAPEPLPRRIPYRETCPHPTLVTKTRVACDPGIVSVCLDCGLTTAIA